MPRKESTQLISAASEMRNALSALRFGSPVTHVYNPLEYAWDPHVAYLKRYGNGPKEVLFVGMNPGPWGMAQTGIPFGEIPAVKQYLKIEGKVSKPSTEHPKRLIEGFACKRSEVSGRRLWGLFASRWPDASMFFRDHFVVNYCPLAFMEAGGKNRTPDQLARAETAPVYEICDAHLRSVVRLLQPDWVVGVGAFAFARAEVAVQATTSKTAQILHPSPASPAANRDWAGQVTKQMRAAGIWE